MFYYENIYILPKRGSAPSEKETGKKRKFRQGIQDALKDGQIKSKNVNGKSKSLETEIYSMIGHYKFNSIQLQKQLASHVSATKKNSTLTKIQKIKFLKQQVAPVL